MKHTYTIKGMTCGNCKATVEKELLAVKYIKDVEVSLEKSQVIVSMEKHISTEELQEALSKKYTISEKEVASIKQESFIGFDEEKSKLEQLKPLFLILVYITVASILINKEAWNWKAFMLDFMGLFYIVFSFFKMLDLKGFPDSFKMYDPIAKKVPVYAMVYPFLETVLGIMFLMRFEIQVALIVTIIILGATTVGVVKTLLDKKAIRCACLGTALKLPMTEATFIENVIMLVMAVLMLM